MDAPKSGSKLTVPYITLFIIFVNIIVFIYTNYLGDKSHIEYIAANIPQLTLTGDYWRLFSNLFLHQNIWHLLSNMLVIFYFGIICEQLYGHRGMTIIYLFSGVGGSLVSALAQFDTNTSGLGLFSIDNVFNPTLTGGLFGPKLIIHMGVGASGAIMGVMVANIIGLLTMETKIQQTRKILFSILATVILTFVNGIHQSVDNYAHFGGLLFGFILAGCYLITDLNFPNNKKTVNPLLWLGVFGLSILIMLHLVDEHREMLLEDRAEIMAYFQNEAIKQAQKKDKEQRYQSALELRKNLPAAVDEKIAQGLSLRVGSANSIIMSPDKERFYVALGEENNIAVIDVISRKVVDKITGPDFPRQDDGCPSNRCRGIGVAGLAISSDGKTLYVTSLTKDSFSIIDLASKKIKKDILTGAYPRAVQISPDGNTAYVINSVDNSISVIDLKTTELIKTVDLPGGTAEHFAFGRQLAFSLSHDGAQLAIFDAVQAKLVVLDTQTMAIKPTEYQSDGLNQVDTVVFSQHDDSLLLSSAKGFTKFDVKSGKVQQDLQWCGQMSKDLLVSTAIDMESNTLAVTDGEGNLWLIDLTSLSNIGHYPSGYYSVPYLMTDHDNMIITDTDSLYFLKRAKSISLAPADTEFLCSAPIGH
ncbi:hypothetical protein C9426_34185 [Serratia sp. S1B]|nr:hypothetical protein C9426_34185 [Serratia sp. S1B]